MKKLRHFACFLFALLPAQAFAVDNITLITGPKTGTYYAFGKDIARVGEPKKIMLDVKDSDGSVDNIKRIGIAKQPALGIVQSDVLGFLNRSQNAQSKKIVSHLRILFPFYQEEVHVLARKEVASFKDLQGKRVAVGEEGSGHMLTAVNLFAIEHITPSEMKKITPEEGVVAVLKGDLDAVVFVGGKPVKMFKNMEDLTKPEYQKYALFLQQVHFLPLSSSKFFEEYEPAEITPKDYAFVKSTVPTVAVQAVLVSYDPGFKAKQVRQQKARCESLRKFAQTVRSGMPSLVASGHPKWREVSLGSEVVGWKKDSCVWNEATAKRR